MHKCTIVRDISLNMFMWVLASLAQVIKRASKSCVPYIENNLLADQIFKKLSQETLQNCMYIHQLIIMQSQSRNIFIIITGGGLNTGDQIQIVHMQYKYKPLSHQG